MLTVETITRGTQLSALQLRAAFRQLGREGTPPADTVLTADHCLGLWVFMLIHKLQFLAPEQKNLLYELVVGQLTGLGKAAQARTLQPPMLVIADCRYAAFHNVTGWLDLVSGDTVEKPENYPLETLAYNLAILFQRNHHACSRLETSGA